MARKKFNVVTIAAMVAILAIGAIGVGYASFTDTLNVNVTASTGYIDAGFVTGSASVSGSFANGVCTAHVDDVDTLAINMTNMYPGYTCTVSVGLVNNGSLPARITSFAPPLTSVPAGITVTPSCNVNTVIENVAETCTVTLTVDAAAESDAHGTSYGTIPFVINFATP